jgi:membrane protease YdiL (CAAX protease family)
MILLMLIAYPVQTRFGMYGLAITEFAILAMALGFAAITKQPFKQVFPFKKPTLTHFGGSSLIYGGAYMLVIATGNLQSYFFPASLEVNQFLSAFFRSETLLIALLIVAVMPGICEELLYRGFLQHSFGGVRPWVRVLTVGIMFGIFHFDIYRFTPTMILGLALSYIMLKTGNLWLPIFFHFIHNAFGVLGTFSLSETIETDASLSFSQMTGIVLFFTGISAILIFIGRNVLNNKKSKDITPSRRLLIYAVSSIIAFAGLITIGLSEMPTGAHVYHINMRAGVGSELWDIHRFDVEKDGEYSFDFKWENAYGSAEIKDFDGNIIYSQSGTDFSNNGKLFFKAGFYTFQYFFEPVREDASFYARIT